MNPHVGAGDDRGDDEIAEAEALDVRGLADLAGLRVLVVDDDPEIVVVLAFVVEATGGFAVSVSGASEATTRLATERFDVILSDLIMPATTGRTFLDWLAVAHPAIPVVTMSGVPEQSARAAQRTNVVATLDKPFTPLELLSALEFAATRVTLA